MCRCLPKAKVEETGNRKPETYNFFPLSFSHIGRVEIVTGISFGFFFYLC
jgi:hypothetical protein